MMLMLPNGTFNDISQRYFICSACATLLCFIVMAFGAHGCSLALSATIVVTDIRETTVLFNLCVVDEDCQL